MQGSFVQLWMRGVRKPKRRTAARRRQHKSLEKRKIAPLAGTSLACTYYASPGDETSINKFPIPNQTNISDEIEESK